MRFGVPSVNNQIPNVRYPRKGIRKNKNGIPFVEEGVAQQQQRTGKAQPPEGGWHHDSLQLLSRIPLNEKPAEEHGVPQPTDRLPDMPFDAQKLAIVPNQIV